MQCLARVGLAALFAFAACETDGGDDYPVGPNGVPGGTSIPGAGGPGVDAGGGPPHDGRFDAPRDAGFDAIGPADSPMVPDSPLVPDAPL